MMTLNDIHDGQQKRVTVTHGLAGWTVREEHGTRVVRETLYRDWHRVERALQTFELRESDLGHSTNR